jgi:hypothetical protein
MQLERKKARRDRPRHRRGMHGAEVRGCSSLTKMSEGGTPFVGLDELENAPGRGTGPARSAAIHRQHLATASTTSAGAARPVEAPRLRVSQGGGRAATIPAPSARFRRCAACSEAATVESLLAAARGLEAQGSRSWVVVISQDTTRYGQDIGAGRDGLARLVRGAAGGDLVPRGSGFCTPTRRRWTNRCCV